MARVTACDVPQGSLLAGFGEAGDYRDCFCREVAGTVTLPEYIERFYCSLAFRPERLVLGLLGRGATNADARALARGETDRIAVWEVVERRSTTSGPQGRPPARSDATEGRESEESLRGRMAPPAPDAQQKEHPGERPVSRKPDRAPAGPEGRGNRSADLPRNTRNLDEILLHSAGTGTASWLAVEPLGDGTRLHFGSWVGNLGQSGWRFMLHPHQWYSRVLLAGC